MCCIEALLQLPLLSLSLSFTSAALHSALNYCQLQRLQISYKHGLLLQSCVVVGGQNRLQCSTNASPYINIYYTIYLYIYLYMCMCLNNVCKHSSEHKIRDIAHRKQNVSIAAHNCTKLLLLFCSKIETKSDKFARYLCTL